LPRAGRLMNAWVREMSGYIKALDARHLVAIGDEGWRCDSSHGAPHQWMNNGTKARRAAHAGPRSRCSTFTVPGQVGQHGSDHASTACPRRPSWEASHTRITPGRRLTLPCP
jgi:hypothetical protein